MKKILILCLFLFGCDILFPPEEGCCVSWNEEGFPYYENPVCFENATFDECKAGNFDYNGSYINESCSEVSEFCP